MIKIALDAGHGLNTAGKQTPNGIKEWELNNTVRNKAVEALSEYDVEIIHTDNNEGSVDESLSSRLNKYLSAGVAAFVSIHHNAYTGSWNSATGVEVYTDKNPTAEDTRLANAIYSRLTEYTGLKGRGIKKAAFTVINQNSIPAVLCEGGFMDGTEDFKVITSAEGQAAYGRAVAEGLVEFLGLAKKSTDTAKTVEDIAREVIAGKWGNGTARKTALTEAGYDYSKVQAAVNALLNVSGETVSTVKYFAKYTGSSVSIVTALKSLGESSSYSYRRKVAVANDISDYSGTAKQNTTLLTRLKQGKLIKP